MADNGACRLGLGTVQFGLDYGIANHGGQVTATEVARILDRAAIHGIRTLDTAHAYGNAEAIIGQALQPEAPFRIITKTLPLRRKSVDAASVRKVAEAFLISLQRLQRDAVDVLLVHHVGDLLASGGDRLYAQLEGWKSQGLVRKIGVSVYDDAQIETLMARYALDVVQLPVSVYDQRLLQNGTLDALRRNGVEIHVRSALLQGVMTMAEEALPPHLAGLAEQHRRYWKMLAARKVSPLAAALSFVRSLPQIDVCLVGVLSVEQLDECVTAFNHRGAFDFSEFAINDPDLIDPRLWPARS